MFSLSSLGLRSVFLLVFVGASASVFLTFASSDIGLPVSYCLSVCLLCVCVCVCFSRVCVCVRVRLRCVLCFMRFMYVVCVFFVVALACFLLFVFLLCFCLIAHLILESLLLVFVSSDRGVTVSVADYVLILCVIRQI